MWADHSLEFFSSSSYSSLRSLTLFLFFISRMIFKFLSNKNNNKLQAILLISFYNFVQLTSTAVLIFPHVAFLFPVLLLSQLTGNSPLTPCHRLIFSGLLSLGCLPFIFLFLSPLTYLRNTLIFSLCSTRKLFCSPPCNAGGEHKL